MSYCIYSALGQSSTHNISLFPDTLIYPDKFLVYIQVDANPGQCDPDYGYLSLDMKISLLKKSMHSNDLDTFNMDEKFYQNENYSILLFTANNTDQVRKLTKVCTFNKIIHPHVKYIYNFKLNEIEKSLFDKALVQFVAINEKLYLKKPYKIIKIKAASFSFMDRGQIIEEASDIKNNFFISSAEKISFTNNIDITFIN